MSKLLRREVPIWTGTLIVVIMFIDFYLDINSIHTLAVLIKDFSIIITVMAAGVGILNTFVRTYNKVNKREKYWYLDIWMILLMVIMAATGLIGGIGTSNQFKWLMNTMYTPLTGAIFGMVFLDICSAFYRGFRARTKEATVLFISAVIVMLYSAPLTGGIFPEFLNIGKWVIDVPNNAGGVAIYIISGLGLLAFAIRLLLQKETPSLGVVD